MTNPTQDPEEQRLRDAVVEAASKLSFSSAISVRDPFVIALLDASSDLAAHRAKASAPEPVLLPCPFCGAAARYGAAADGDNWVECSSCATETCICVGDTTAAAQARKLWNARHSPAPPDIWQPPTDSEIIGWVVRELGGPFDVRGRAMWQIIKDAVTHFSPHSNATPTVEPTIESVVELVQKMPRGTIWKTQLAELVEYTKLALVRFNSARAR